MLVATVRPTVGLTVVPNRARAHQMETFDSIKGNNLKVGVCPRPGIETGPDAVISSVASVATFGRLPRGVLMAGHCLAACVNCSCSLYYSSMTIPRDCVVSHS